MAAFALDYIVPTNRNIIQCTHRQKSKILDFCKISKNFNIEKKKSQKTDLTSCRFGKNNMDKKTIVAVHTFLCQKAETIC